MCIREYRYWKYRDASIFHTRIFRIDVFRKRAMKENTIALKFYNIAIDASLIDRWNKKNIVSSTEE